MTEKLDLYELQELKTSASQNGIITSEPEEIYYLDIAHRLKGFALSHFNGVKITNKPLSKGSQWHLNTGNFALSMAIQVETWITQPDNRKFPSPLSEKQLKYVNKMLGTWYQPYDLHIEARTTIKVDREFYETLFNHAMATNPDIIPDEFKPDHDDLDCYI